LAQGVEYIKWTFEPTGEKTHINLEKLGAVVLSAAKFLRDGLWDSPEIAGQKFGLASDRCQWHLESESCRFGGGRAVVENPNRRLK
jgi:predicted GNAT superfamily acetyltransferase